MAGENTVTKVSAGEFELDTSHFDDFITESSKLAEKMENTKNDLDSMKNEIIQTWVGKGRNMFEKKYRLLSQQFGDLSDELRQISEDLLAIEEAYIQADTDLSKSIEGKDSRY